MAVCVFIGDWKDNELTGNEGSRHPDYAVLGCKRMTTGCMDSNKKGNGTIQIKEDSFGALIPASLRSLELQYTSNSNMCHTVVFQE